MLYAIREVTAVCVGAIDKWKAVAQEARPGSPGVAGFVWQGLDYSHKLLTDLNFIAACPLAQYLPYRIINNPFLHPDEGVLRAPPPRRDPPAPALASTLAAPEPPTLGHAGPLLVTFRVATARFNVRFFKDLVASAVTCDTNDIVIIDLLSEGPGP